MSDNMCRLGRYLAVTDEFSIVLSRPDNIIHVPYLFASEYTVNQMVDVILESLSVQHIKASDMFTEEFYRFIAIGHYNNVGTIEVEDLVPMIKERMEKVLVEDFESRALSIDTFILNDTLYLLRNRTIIALVDNPLQVRSDYENFFHNIEYQIRSIMGNEFTSLHRARLGKFIKELNIVSIKANSDPDELWSKLDKDNKSKLIGAYLANNSKVLKEVLK